MKRITGFLLAIVAVFCFSLTDAKAAMWELSRTGIVDLWAEPGGIINVRGPECDVQKITNGFQFCPDEWKGACPRNWPVPVKYLSPGHAIIQLSSTYQKLNQRAFQLKNGALWARVMDPCFRTGPGIVREWSGPSADSENGNGGHHFTYVLDVPGYIAKAHSSFGNEVDNSMCTQVGYVPQAPAVYQPPPVAPKAQAAPKVTPKVPTGCTDCEKEILSVVQDTNVVVKRIEPKVDSIQKSVGVISPTDKPGSQTLQEKSSRTLELVEAIAGKLTTVDNTERQRVAEVERLKADLPLTWFGYPWYYWVFGILIIALIIGLVRWLKKR